MGDARFASRHPEPPGLHNSTIRSHAGHYIRTVSGAQTDNGASVGNGNRSRGDASVRFGSHEIRTRWQFSCPIPAKARLRTRFQDAVVDDGDLPADNVKDGYANVFVTSDRSQPVCRPADA